MAEAVEQAEQHGYVSTLFGRRRQIPELRARNWQTRKLGERLAVNTVIQGTAADIIKVAMVHCHDALAAAGLVTRVILQIHDELLFEGPGEEAEAAAAIVSREMVQAAGVRPAAGGRQRHRAELARREVGQAPPSSIAGQRSMATRSPAARARAAAAWSITPSWSQTAFAPTAIASSTWRPAYSERRNTSTTSTGSGSSRSDGWRGRRAARGRSG